MITFPTPNSLEVRCDGCKNAMGRMLKKRSHVEVLEAEHWSVTSGVPERHYCRQCTLVLGCTYE